MGQADTYPDFQSESLLADYPARLIVPLVPDTLERLVVLETEGGFHSFTRAPGSGTVARGELDAEILRAEAILQIPPDFDGRGSPGYSRETLLRVAEFLRRGFDVMKVYGFSGIEAPSIRPGPSGSIDVKWELEDRNLLLNVPADTADLAGYFGDSLDGAEIEGSFRQLTPTFDFLFWVRKE